MLIIDPQDNLPQAKIENEKIISLLKDDVRIDDPVILKGRKEATWSQVRSYLQEESFDILHVAAHAKFDKKKGEDTGIVLSGDTVLRPRDIFYDLKGDPPWLIFMNACESAKTRDLNHFDKYDELSTLADTFVGAGASSYIGTSGIINDSSASEIAVDFYNNLLGGATVAESLRKAKTDFFKYNQNDLSWSSFKIYGNPMKKIELNESYEDLETKVKRWYVRTRSCDPMNCAADLGADINEVMEILSRLCRKK